MSKLIILNGINAEKVMNAFKLVQGKSSSRTIESFEELIEITKDVENRIGSMPKSCLNGTSIEYNFQQHFASKYNGRPYSTHFVLVFDKGNWKIDIESIKRDTCPNNSKEYMYNLKLSEKAKEKILQRYR